MLGCVKKADVIIIAAGAWGAQSSQSPLPSSRAYWTQ
jgi:hypothetical protein